MRVVLECVRPEFNERKFWTAEVVLSKAEGWQVFLTWGRIGTTGQALIKRFDTEGECERFVRDRLDEKIRRGYIYRSAERPTARPSPPPYEPEPVPVPRSFPRGSFPREPAKPKGPEVTVTLVPRGREFSFDDE